MISLKGQAEQPEPCRDAKLPAMCYYFLQSLDKGKASMGSRWKICGGRV